MANLLRLVLAPVLVSAIAGCGGGSQTASTTSASTGGAAAGAAPLDIRRFIGPDYCPELRIRPGDEVMRNYAGREEDPAQVVWQASLGKTARECLYELDGSLTLKVGASGRVVAGPKGGPGEVRIPLRISVVKFKEAVIVSELYPLTVTIPASNSAVFTEVHELKVPSPAQDRDYIIYVGLDEDGENLLEAPREKPPAPPPPVASVAPPAPAAPPPAAPAPTPPAQSGPRVLDVPSDGVILPGQGFDQPAGN